jgi:hypothetical protein
MAIFSSLSDYDNKELEISPDFIIGKRIWTQKIWIDNDGSIFIGDVDSNRIVRSEQQLQIETGDTLYIWYSSLEDVMTFIELYNRGIRVVLVKRTAVAKGWALTTLEILGNSNKTKSDGL